jgi:hypothetical protein
MEDTGASMEDTGVEDTSVSLCIPRVENNYNKDFIIGVFNNCKLGVIDRVDIVPNHKENAKFNRVFVHYKSINNINLLDRLRNGGSLKVVYSNPWFWKCIQSRIQKKKNL